MLAGTSRTGLSDVMSMWTIISVTVQNNESKIWESSDAWANDLDRFGLWELQVLSIRMW